MNRTHVRVGLFSDWHLGITTAKSIRKTLRRMAKEENVDVWVNAGDNCGGHVGSRSVSTISFMCREYLGSAVPILAVLGNHDFWEEPRTFHVNGETRTSRPTESAFKNNLTDIMATFRDNGVHWLDADGPFYIHGVTFIGNSMWYAHPAPPTNDAGHLPFYVNGEATHSYLQRRAYRLLEEQMTTVYDRLPKGARVVFVSHFPVIWTDHDPLQEKLSGPPGVGEAVIKLFGCEHFLCGHAHQRHNGPLRYEAGSDYRSPSYMIIDVPIDGPKITLT